MGYISLTIGLIIIVYWCRSFIQRHIQGVSRLLNLGSRGGFYVYTLVFFPGVLIHEMAHFLIASVLGVRTGEIKLLPDINQKTERHSTALGSVQVAKADAFRSSLIGAAPFLIGSGLIYFLEVNFIWKFNPLNSQLNLLNINNLQPSLVTIICLYLVFVIGNTMFSSKEDTHSWPLLVILGLTITIIGFFSGTLAGAVGIFLPYFISIAQAMFGAYLFIVMLDIVFILLLAGTEKGLERILNKRVRYEK